MKKPRYITTAKVVTRKKKIFADHFGPSVLIKAIQVVQTVLDLERLHRKMFRRF